MIDAAHLPFRRRAIIEELEQRILFSADFSPVLLLPNDALPTAEIRQIDAQPSAIQSPAHALSHELVIVDADTPDYEKLVNELLAQNTGNGQFDVVVLDANRDGIQQLNEILSQARGLDAVHLLSHGADGSVLLGTSLLDASTLTANATSFEGWRQAFNAHADFLIYGCDVAASQTGRTLIETLARLTGADVAASTDLTGNAAQGGDWDLEYQTGAIESTLAFGGVVQNAWTGTLAAPTIDLDGNNSSGAVGANYVVTAPAAGGAVAITDIDAKLADSDSTNLASLTVSISNLLNGANESLNAVTTGTAITASYASGTGVLTLSGADTVGHYQQVLRTITYQNTAASPDRTARVINFLANDGVTPSNTGSTTVSWQYVRDNFNAAAYNGNNGTVNWNGNWVEVSDDASATTGSVIVSGGVVSRDVSGMFFGDSTLRGISRAVNLAGATTAFLSLDYTSSASGATFQIDVSSNGGGSWTTLASLGGSAGWTTLTYDISAYATATTQVRMTSSSSGFFASGSVDIDNVGVGYDASAFAPVLDLDANNSSGAAGANYNGSFVEGTAAAAADADATLTDSDSANLNELVATIANPLDGVAESLSVNLTGTSILASYDSSTATLTLSGADTRANYQQVLRTLVYNNSSQTPNTTSRIINIAASDGTNHSNRAMTTLLVTAANDPPVNSVPAGQSTTEDTTLVFPGTISISDVDAGGSSVQVTLTGTQGVLTLASVGGLSFITGDGSADASMSFTGSIANINTALNGLGFLPNANYPGAASLQIITSDLGNTGSGGTLTDTDSVAITIVSVNDAPVITSNGGGAAAAVSVAENTTAVTTVTSTDVDGPAPTYSITGGADAALFTINASTGVLTFTSARNFEAPTDAGANNVYDVTVQVSDGSLTDSQTVAVTVTNANEAPVWTTSTAFADKESLPVAETLTASDVDGDPLSWTISGGADASLFTIDTSTGVLQMTSVPDFENPWDANGDNVYEVTIQVSDGNGGTLVQPIQLAVTNAVDAVQQPTAGEGQGSGNIEIAKPPLNEVEKTVVVQSHAQAQPEPPAIQPLAEKKETAIENAVVESVSRRITAGFVGVSYQSPATNLDDDAVPRLELGKLLNAIVSHDRSAEAEFSLTGFPGAKPLNDDNEMVWRIAQASTVGLSLGALWWLTQTGGLLSAVLATMPVWRNLDALPILGPSDDDDEEEADSESESEESDVTYMFDAGSGR